MRTRSVAAALVLCLLQPVAVFAQDWVMDWTDHGNITATIPTWDLSGSSPTTLTPRTGGLPPDFTSPAYNLVFTWQNHTYGGPVAVGFFQAETWSVPARCLLPACTFTANFGGGEFHFTDANHFTLDVGVGIGHNNAHLIGLGTRTGGSVATALEPASLGFAGVGLGLAIWQARRRRRA